jgi:hypothetical protein
MLSTKPFVQSKAVVSKAVSLASAHGVPAHIFISSTADTLSLGSLPIHVWPTSSIRHRADVLSALSSAGNHGTVIEVPTYSAPWYHSKLSPQASWCGLSALLAAGIGCAGDGDPDVGRTIINKYDAKLDQNARNRLGALLSTHLLGIPTGSQRFGMSAAELAISIWDTTDAMDTQSPPAWLLPTMLGLLAGRFVSTCGASNRAVVSASNEWFAHLNERRRRLREASGLSQKDASPRVSQVVLESSCSILIAALNGLEWLRFACRPMILLAKHTDWMQQSGDQGLTWQEELERLQKALGSLPPAKGSDLRNNFLQIAERSIGREGDSDPDVPMDSETRHALGDLWHGGLRFGAALELEPWIGMYPQGRTRAK